MPNTRALIRPIGSCDLASRFGPACHVETAENRCNRERSTAERTSSQYYGRCDPDRPKEFPHRRRPRVLSRRTPTVLLDDRLMRSPPMIRRPMGTAFSRMTATVRQRKHEETDMIKKPDSTVGQILGEPDFRPDENSVAHHGATGSVTCSLLGNSLTEMKLELC